MKWFYNLNLKPQGPFELDVVLEKIKRGEISPNDLMMREDSEQWLPAKAWQLFDDSLFPANQLVDKSFAAEKTEWVLLRNGTQEGPYLASDVKKMLRTKQLSAETYVWKNGLTGWVRIMDRAEFDGIFATEDLFI